MSQFGSLDALQNDLAGHAIHLLGVNMIGAEEGTPEMVDGHGIPWLQDSFESQAWTQWRAKHFDLMILDESNTPVMVINLAEHDLTDPANYAELKAMLLEMAGE